MWTALIALILQFESFKHTPYHDRAQRSYGYGTKATENMCITQEWAATLAIRELKKHERVVASLKGLNETQKAALTSLSYNIGPNAFLHSRLYDLIEEGKMCQASDEFGRWIYQNGRPLKGLVKRRIAEKALFAKGLHC